MGHNNYYSSTKNKYIKKGGIDPFLAGIIVFTVLLFGAVVYFGTKIGTTVQIPLDNKVELSTDSNKYDWGTVDYDGGILTKSFAVKNTSNSVLKFYDVKTSCMCTTAQLKTYEAVSPKYDMHEKTNDVFEVKPEETAELIIEFDPTFHGPSSVGPISRTITMSTNAAKNPTLSFYLTANVVKK